MKLSFTVPFKEGLHARPAADLVKICQKADSDIAMTKGDMSVNPKSIIGIISLGAASGEEVGFEINGSDEEQVAASLTEFFQA